MASKAAAARGGAGGPRDKEWVDPGDTPAEARRHRAGVARDAKEIKRWKRHIHPENNEPYWTKDGVAVWDDPAETIPEEREIRRRRRAWKRARASGNQAAIDKAEEEEEASHWRATEHPDDGNTYWRHKEAPHKVVWDDPVVTLRDKRDLKRKQLRLKRARKRGDSAAIAKAEDEVEAAQWTKHLHRESGDNYWRRKGAQDTVVWEDPVETLRNKRRAAEEEAAVKVAAQAAASDPVLRRQAEKATEKAARHPLANFKPVLESDVGVSAASGAFHSMWDAHKKNDWVECGNLARKIPLASKECRTRLGINNWSLACKIVLKTMYKLTVELQLPGLRHAAREALMAFCALEDHPQFKTIGHAGADAIGWCLEADDDGSWTLLDSAKFLRSTANGRRLKQESVPPRVLAAIKAASDEEEVKEYAASAEERATRDAEMKANAEAVAGELTTAASRSLDMADAAATSAAADEGGLAIDGVEAAPIVATWKPKVTQLRNATVASDLWILPAEGDDANRSVDRARGCTTSASSESRLRASSTQHVTDGNDSTFFCTNGSQQVQWVSVDLGRFVATSRLTIVGNGRNADKRFLERTRIELLLRGTVVWYNDVGMNNSDGPYAPLARDCKSEDPQYSVDFEDPLFVADCVRLRKHALSGGFCGDMRKQAADTYILKSIRVFGLAVTADPTKPLPETVIDDPEIGSEAARAAGRTHRHAYFDVFKAAEEPELPRSEILRIFNSLWELAQGGDFEGVLDLAPHLLVKTSKVRKYLGDRNWGLSCNAIVKALHRVSTSTHVPGLRGPARKVILSFCHAVEDKGSNSHEVFSGRPTEWALTPEPGLFSSAALGQLLNSSTARYLQFRLPRSMVQAALRAVEDDADASRASSHSRAAARRAIERMIPGLRAVGAGEDALNAYNAQKLAESGSEPTGTTTVAEEPVSRPVRDFQKVIAPSSLLATGCCSAPAKRSGDKAPSTRLLDASDDRFGKGVWKSKGFTGKLLSPYISNTSIEGGTFFESLSMHVSALRSVLEDTSNAAPLLADDVAALDSVRRVLKVLEVASNFGNDVPQKLEGLDVGEHALLLGGWSNTKSSLSHAITIVVGRIDANTFSFTICNAGSCASAHPRHDAASYPRQGVRAIILQVSAKVVLNPALWMFAARSWHHMSTFNTGPALYDFIFTELSPELAFEAVAVSDDHPLQVGNDYVTEQLSGTCYLRSLSVAVRLLLRRAGLSVPQYKSVTFAQRRMLLHRAREDLQAIAAERVDKFCRTAGVNSHLRVIEYGCRQTALCALKETDAGRLPVRAVQSTHSCIRDIHRLIAEVVDVPEAPPLLEDHDSGTPGVIAVPHTCQVFPGLNMLIRHSQEAALPQLISLGLHGSELPIYREPYIDLLAGERQLESGLRLTTLLRCVLATNMQCSALYNEYLRSMDTGPLHQLASQVTFTATRLLPSPKPEGMTQMCPWRSRPLSVAEQTKALMALSNIAFLFVGSCRCLPQTREVIAARVITTAVLLVMTDVVVRAAPASHMSRILRTTGGRKVRVDTMSWSPEHPQTFAKVSESLVVTDPALSVARDAVIAYFASQEARKTPVLGLRSNSALMERIPVDDASFSFDEDTDIPTQTLVEWIAAAAGISRSAKPAMYTPPIEIRGFDSELPSAYEWRMGWFIDLAGKVPAWAAWRDVTMLYKLCLDGWARPAQPVGKRLITWTIVEGTKTGSVVHIKLEAWGGRDHLVPAERQLPRSAADVPHLLGLADGKHVTEEEIVQAQRLPSFEDSLSQEDAEQFLCALSAPYVRVPLLLRFFSETQLGGLFNAEVKKIVHSGLFELGPHQPLLCRPPEPESVTDVVGAAASETCTCGPCSGEDPAAVPSCSTCAAADTALVPPADSASYSRVVEALSTLPVPTHTRSLAFGTPFGRFCNELTHAASAVLDPLVKLGAAARALPIGRGYDTLWFFVCRLLAAAESWTRPPATSIASESKPVTSLRDFVRDKAVTRLEAMLENATTDAGATERDTRLLCRIHAHAALLHSNFAPHELTALRVGRLVGSLAFVNGWHERPRVTSQVSRKLHRAGVAAGSRVVVDDDSALLMSHSLLFDVMCRQRSAVATWIAADSTSAEDRHLALTIVARRATGRGEDLVFNSFVDNSRDHQPLRFSARTVVSTAATGGAGGKSETPSSEGEAVVVDLSQCIVYFEGQRVRLLPAAFRSRPEVGWLLGDSERPHCVPRMHSQYLEWVTAWWGGDAYELQLWRASHNSDLASAAYSGAAIGFPVPTSPSPTASAFMYNGVLYDRVYDTQHDEPASEAWLRSPDTSPLPAFVIMLYYGSTSSLGARIGVELPGDSPYASWGQMLLPHEPVAADASEVTLLMLARVAVNDGREPMQEWREVVVLRDRRLVHMFRLISVGRRAVREQIWTSDYRFSLIDYVPSVSSRDVLPPSDMLYNGGRLALQMFDAQDGLLSASLVITRNGKQIVLPSMLRGIVPDAILGSYVFELDAAEGHRIIGRPRPGVDRSWVAEELLMTVTDGRYSRVSCRRPVPTLAGTHELVLADVLRAPADSWVSRAASVLTRLDTLAYVLFWCSAADGRLMLVELPRLCLRFVPGQDAAGCTRLFSVDYSGLFVCDKRSEGVRNLIAGLDTAIVLQDAGSSLHVLMPAADMHRPTVKHVPMSSFIVVDRASPEWRVAIPARVFLYAVHSSEAFLAPPSLAAAFYLALALLMQRRYSDASHVLKASCNTDAPFTADVRHVVGGFRNTLEDESPDACACRARVWLCTKYVDETLPFDAQEQATKAFGNMMHLSGECSMTSAEACSLLAGNWCAKYDSWLQIREQVWAAEDCADEGCDIAAASESRTDDIALSAKRTTMPTAASSDHPWSVLTSTTRYFVEKHASAYFGVGGPQTATPTQHWVVNKIRYKRFGSLSTTTIPARLFNVFCDLLLEDSWGKLCGAANGLSFGALYELLTGTVTIQVPGPKVRGVSRHRISATMARIALRASYRAASENGLDEDGRVLFRILGAVHDAIRKDPVAVRRLLPRFPITAETEDELAAGLDPMNDNVLRAFFIELFSALLGTSECRSALERKLSPSNAEQPIVERINVTAEATRNARITRPGSRVTDSLARRVSCAAPQLVGSSLTTLPVLADTGLEDDVRRFAEWRDAPESEKCRHEDALPFDLSWAQPASSSSARSDLGRLSDDFSAYRRSQACEKRAVLLPHVSRGAPEGEATAAELLRQLVSILRDAEERTVLIAEQAVEAATSLANAVNPVACTASQGTEWRFALQRAAGLSEPVDIAYLAATLASSEGEQDRRSCNRTLPMKGSRAQRLTDSIAAALLLVNRRPLVSAALEAAGELLALVKRGGAWGKHACEQMCETVAQRLYATRCYGDWERNRGAAWSCDPRFLVFEFQMDVLLRQRQVDLVLDFVRAAEGQQSRVRQMIMGAGKTTVVAPLVALMLADGRSLVTSVVPSALLDMSIKVTRSRFSTVLRKSVLSMRFDRLSTINADQTTALVRKLQHARDSAGLVVTTPDAIKSLLLRWIELRQEIADMKSGRRTRERTTLIRMWNDLATIVRMWGVDNGLSSSTITGKPGGPVAMTPAARLCPPQCDGDRLDGRGTGGVLIIDEVDIVLHPLTSELNFPIGPKTPLEPRPARWELPLFLLDGMLYFDTHKLSDVDVVDPMDPTPEAERAHKVLNRISKVMNAACEAQWMQRVPHTVLLQRDAYAESLRPLVAEWALVWLQARWEEPRPHTIKHHDAVSYLCGAQLGGAVSQRVAEAVGTKNVRNIQLLNLARDWCTVLLPHAMSKRNRVNYGLLRERDMLIKPDMTPPSRFLCAVPFIGLDTPSPTSEFAHPDVQIGLTALSYRYEGLRRRDVKAVVSQLKRDLLHEAGAARDRASYRRFANWMETAGCSSSLPLDVCQPNDAEQLEDMWKALRRVPGVVSYFLRQQVFPAAMRLQTVKLSASGQELGSDMLFARRIGFSGTPSNMLPTDLLPCGFETGSDGKVVSVLTSTEVASHSLAPSDWSVRSLLTWIATASPPFSALIDAGALITGFSNEAAVRWLLEVGLTEMDAACFLDDEDRPMVIVRGHGGAPQPLALCGVERSRLFVLFDHVHTTGMDIKQYSRAHAAVTLGKDMSLRDAAQGAWRMRQLGAGQTMCFVVVPEMASLITTELQGGRGVLGLSGTALSEAFYEDSVPCAEVLRAIVAWLTLNGLRKARMQHDQLRLQDARVLYRRAALHSIIKGAQNRSLYGSRERGRCTTEKEKRALEVFEEPVEFKVADSVMPPPTPRDAALSWMASFADVVSSRAAAIATARLDEEVDDDSTHEAGGAGGAGGAGRPERADAAVLSSEMTREQEQEVEQEQEQEIEREVVVGYAKDPGGELRWHLSKLAGSPYEFGRGDLATTGGIYPLSEFTLPGLEPMASAFPDNAFLSQNLARERVNSTAPRRLKNVTVLLEWVPPGAEARGTVFEGDGRVVVAISLQEAEAIRRALHVQHPALSGAALCLRLHTGQLLDTAPAFTVSDAGSLGAARLTLRFFNSETYFTRAELRLLAGVMGPDGAAAGSAVSHVARLRFFSAVQQCRRRDRYGVAGTHVAELLSGGATPALGASTLWACGWCGLVNPASRVRCSSCRRPRIRRDAKGRAVAFRISAYEQVAAAEQRDALKALARRWRAAVCH